MLDGEEVIFLEYVLPIIVVAGAILILSCLKPIEPTFSKVDWSQRRKCQSNPEKLMFDALAKWDVVILTQVPIKQYQIDLFLPKYKLAIECDSIFHDTPEAQERDRKKDVAITEAGWKVIRVRDEEIKKDMTGVLSKVAQAMDWTPEEANKKDDESAIKDQIQQKASR
ncbi:uncharacterized protein DUF559 [Aneurinibacillus soli]|uniref:Uncharacterized protein n=1 Tax=Aneurinibacillus soli TaxID=1500254 RepID=A0A0U5B9C4_9BACL|nr:DUF559 domain-containing protein [Aneurinibacillus soli]PYE64233.1 uncharacterized protein DUF559 [Aneurinibacillus soli]BAU28182.1 hypothetical protein CB4_02356 [Aneurinibacillus soli]